MSDQKETIRALKIGAGVAGGFLIGLLIAGIVVGDYDILGTICVSAIVIPLCAFGCGFIVAWKTAR